jgi:hypothetical protein
MELITLGLDHQPMEGKEEEMGTNDAGENVPTHDATQPELTEIAVTDIVPVKVFERIAEALEKLAERPVRVFQFLTDEENHFRCCVLCGSIEISKFPEWERSFGPGCPQCRPKEKSDA